MFCDVCFVMFCSSAKSTELLPNSQEGSKKIQSLHSSANLAQQSVGPTGFGDGEADNLPGLFIFKADCIFPFLLFSFVLLT